MRKIVRTAEGGHGSFKSALSRWAKARTLAQWQRNQQAPTGALAYCVDRLALRPMRELMGFDRAFACLTGSTFLSSNTLDYMLSWNVPILEAYGASECGWMSLCMDPSLPGSSVGRPVGGTSVRLVCSDGGEPIDDDEARATGRAGEVVTYSRGVFMGYVGERKKTRQSIDENGWMHTGDVGRFDTKGRLYIW